MRPSLIIFTDLDGTLLDHATYSFAAAEAALAAIKDRNIPLIFATSKTAAEIEALRKEIGIHAPAIVENGAGLDIPEAVERQPAGNSPANVPRSTSTYADIVEQLSSLPTRLKNSFRGFSQMSDQKLATETGLSISAARLAKDRQWSEPVRWTGSANDFEDWLKALKALDLTVTEGGRFHTVSRDAGKHEQMAAVLDLYRDRESGRENKIEPTVVALGDAPNDREMLCSADIAVVIKGTKSHLLSDLESFARGTVWRPALSGPQGWNDAVLHAIDLYDVD